MIDKLLPIIMLTRSKSKQFSTYCSEIDFIYASNAWLSNKKRLGNGTYEYINTNRHSKHKSIYKNKKLTQYERMLLDASVIQINNSNVV